MIKIIRILINLFYFPKCYFFLFLTNINSNIKLLNYFNIITLFKNKFLYFLDIFIFKKIKIMKKQKNILLLIEFYLSINNELLALNEHNFIQKKLYLY
jgi:hypothetical protein